MTFHYNKHQLSININIYQYQLLNQLKFRKKCERILYFWTNVSASLKFRSLTFYPYPLILLLYLRKATPNKTKFGNNK